MDVLNHSFRNAQLQFRLSEVKPVDNAAWSRNQDSTAMKTQLHVGDAKQLNIYILQDMGGKMAETTYPWDYARNPELDGCSIIYSTLPGGETQDYNLGINLVHEVGHWLGLYDVAKGGKTCSYEGGDRVRDTAPQVEGTVGCPKIPEDSCRDQWGPDNIHNFMDTSAE